MHREIKDNKQLELMILKQLREVVFVLRHLERRYPHPNYRKMKSIETFKSIILPSREDIQ
jgi:hypothetical protein